MRGCLWCLPVAAGAFPEHPRAVPTRRSRAALGPSARRGDSPGAQWRSLVSISWAGFPHGPHPSILRPKRALSPRPVSPQRGAGGARGR